MTTKQNRPSRDQQPGGEKRNNRRSKRSTNRSGGQPVYRGDGKVVIGVTTGNTFVKRVQGSKHMLRQPRGWATDTDVLDEVRARGVTIIKVIDRESGISYVAHIGDFDRYGVMVHRQHGVQLCLPLKYWSVDGVPPALPMVNTPSAEQMRLW